MRTVNGDGTGADGRASCRGAGCEIGTSTLTSVTSRAVRSSPEAWALWGIFRCILSTSELGPRCRGAVCGRCPRARSPEPPPSSPPNAASRGQRWFLAGPASFRRCDCCVSIIASTSLPWKCPSLPSIAASSRPSRSAAPVANSSVPRRIKSALTAHQNPLSALARPCRTPRLCFLQRPNGSSGARPALLPRPGGGWLRAYHTRSLGAGSSARRALSGAALTSNGQCSGRRQWPGRRRLPPRSCRQAPPRGPRRGGSRRRRRAAEQPPLPRRT